MTKAKRWLSRAINIDAEISEIETQIGKELEKRKAALDALTKTTPSYNGMPSSGGDVHKFDRLAELESAVDRLVDELVDEKERLAKTKEEISRAIDMVADGRRRRVLRMLYINGFTMGQVAARIGRSYKQCCRIHGAALEEMEDIIE